MDKTKEKMYCYQCQETSQGTGCSISGVCGKDPETALMQDLLIHQAKGVSNYAIKLREKGIKNKLADKFVIEALFTTVTNVNFDPDTLKDLIRAGEEIKLNLKKEYEKINKNEEITFNSATFLMPKKDIDIFSLSNEIGIKKRKEKFTEDIIGLQELLMYGLKGMAAYADHALILGKEDDSVFEFFHKALNYLSGDNFTIEELFNYNLECGEVNLKAMALLDSANTSVYSNPVPTKVRITSKKGKAILISGHDLKDLEELLKQTEGKNINIYTHGEMLPAHGYPELKKYKHLVGNYGDAWYKQKKEFKEFPGSILMTTNCIQNPQGYKEKIFTSGVVQWPGVKHLTNKDFSPLIEQALKEKGFEKDEEEKYINVGFAHNTVISIAPTIIDMIKKGKIKHFFLVGGCDGHSSKRNYYKEFVEKTPKDTIVLTLACGKYRFNKLDLGTIDSIPRLLDMGQCNDAYSAIQVALALSKALNVSVNDLPLSLNVSWYEQKAVCILLTLLYLGIKNIRLGPTLPAFLTKNILNILQEKYNIMTITTPEEDLKAMLEGK